MAERSRDTISVRTEVVLDVLVESLHTEAAAMRIDALPAALDGVEHREIACAGYFARIVETARFAPAREPIPWLADALRAQGAAELAADLAAREPLERPDPGHPSSSAWSVPGPGGHVRHYLALRAIGREWAGDDRRRLELKRAWMFGFYLRCCEETARVSRAAP